MVRLTRLPLLFTNRIFVVESGLLQLELAGANHSLKLVLEHSNFFLELSLDHGLGVKPMFELHVVGCDGALKLRNQSLRLLVLLKLVGF